MKVLVDSHAFLWEVLDDPRLSKPAQEIWDDAANELLISPASLWEIAIKVGNGKLQVSRPLEAFFESEMRLARMDLLPIEPRHAAKVGELPRHHLDPFDRMLIAQALCEGLPILSVDRQLDAYGVTRVW